jgi:hypothetical protein
MAALGIHTGGDLRARDLAFLRQHFGGLADYLYRAARGIDLRRVSPNRAQVAGGERTFDRDISSGPGLRGALEGIIDLVWGDIAKAQAKGRTITLKLRLSDFTIHTHARTLDHVVSAREEFAAVARALLDDVLPLRQPARLMGLTLSGLEERAAPARLCRKGADGPVLIGLPARSHGGHHADPPRHAARCPAIWSIIGPVIGAGETYALNPAMGEEEALAYWLGADKQTFVAEDKGAVLGTYYLRANQAGGGAHVANCGYMTSPAARGAALPARCARIRWIWRARKAFAPCSSTSWSAPTRLPCICGRRWALPSWGACRGRSGIRRWGLWMRW